MKKLFKTALVVLVVLALILGAVAIWQWSNIKAVFMSVRYSSEEIDTLVEENENEIDRILKSITQTEIRALTDEEVKKLQSGELSKEEALMIIKGVSGSEQPSDDAPGASEGNSADLEQVAPEESSSATTGKSESGTGVASEGSSADSGSSVDDIIAEMYLLRAQYVGALAGLEAEAAAYVKGIPSKDWNVSKKLEAIDIYTGKAVALEGQCDGLMNGLIAKLEAELKRTGGDTSVVADVKSVYASEKELKKSQLLSKYGNYL